MDPLAFRSAARSFLAAELDRLRADFPGLPFTDPVLRRAFEDRVCRGGWSGLNWPKEAGGQALPIDLIAIFLEECARAGIPKGINLIGHGILAPTLLLHGSPEQKARFLPGILANTEIWCQGYSEPDAGSDLAALRTRAERDGDHYVVTGQKIWTSYAHLADWCFLLARTDPAAARHKGISFFLVDMKSPGITVRPIRQMDGQEEFNEVFFNRVRVPVDLRVGEENAGWAIAMAAASYERATYFIPRLVQMEQELADLVAVSREMIRDGRRVCDDPLVRDAFARLFVDVQALKLHARTMLAAAARHEQPGPEGSFIKLLWSESHQRLLDLALTVIGPEVLLGPHEPSAIRHRHWQRDHLWSRAETILAGTSEIQRNVVGERALGLPR
ncbi:acyl-CoA dehydrogenase family protein [Phreatobacter sp. AB_2022a]|uniref:acyl-CoA dehydrogenase family protein n=1 Tax=Phreatobacter sp. AB_2022a TaxID=3003134 RepID=UPI0022874A8E|nr:acyl-CoA dehydrogenase family protein [Phreatobacter sp. AB_2022a]MCZ0732622.1 acyl-CoA dehydrogenase family protein [Phreatobacter sp. AB_2022a]